MGLMAIPPEIEGRPETSTSADSFVVLINGVLGDHSPFGSVPLMIRAVIQNGQIHPLDPLPAEWTEGRQVLIEAAEPPSSDDLEAWHRELLELGPAQYEPGEWERVQAILSEADELAKAVVRRQMGLS